MKNIIKSLISGSIYVRVCAYVSDFFDFITYDYIDDIAACMCCCRHCCR